MWKVNNPDRTLARIPHTSTVYLIAYLSSFLCTPLPKVSLFVIYNESERIMFLRPTFPPRGMTVTSGSVSISKDNSNLIGISIGGGAPLCPCLYIVQVGIHFVLNHIRIYSQ